VGSAHTREPLKRFNPNFYPIKLRFIGNYIHTDICHSGAKSDVRTEGEERANNVCEESKVIKEILRSAENLRSE